MDPEQILPYPTHYCQGRAREAIDGSSTLKASQGFTREKKLKYGNSIGYNRMCEVKDTINLSPRSSLDKMLSPEVGTPAAYKTSINVDTLSSFPLQTTQQTATSRLLKLKVRENGDIPHHHKNDPGKCTNNKPLNENPNPVPHLITSTPRSCTINLQMQNTPSQPTTLFSMPPALTATPN